MSQWEYGRLGILALPQIIVTVTALVALVVDLAWLREKSLKRRMNVAAVVTLLGCAAAVAWLAMSGGGRTESFGDGMLVVHGLNRLMQAVVLVLTVCTVFISLGSSFTEHVGEYFALLLLATVGMMFLVSTENLLMVFLSLELLSLCLYVLTAYDRSNIASAEAGLKYFLFGSMSAAFMLFGLSLLYGLTGEINLTRMALKIGGAPFEPLLAVALILVLTGFGFKVAAVPFHLWAPDAYQGAPAASAAFIASGSKVASFFIMAQVLVLGLAGAEGNSAWQNFRGGWMSLVALIAAFSMVLGNLAAIVQKSVRRLLAYSAIAQGGYMLLGILAESHSASAHHGLAALIYYSTTYALTLIGAFGVVAAVEKASGADHFPAFGGLVRRAPGLAWSMLVFMLSLAGIPPLAGFFGKFYLFTAALTSPTGFGLLWLVVLAVLMSTVSLYYYLQVLKQVFVAEAETGLRAISLPVTTLVTIVTLAAAVVLLGCFPDLVLGKLLTIIRLGAVSHY